MTDTGPPEGLDETAAELYGLHPDAFVPARDDAVASAREQGDRELARAIGRLRKPTRAAWLANLLARRRPAELAGLLAIAPQLAAAQRTLDGDALRTLSARRQQLVRAMAREAGRLAGAAGEAAGEALLRELQGVLEAALVDADVADELRAGRLTRAVSYSGFGPAADDGVTPVPRPGTDPAGPAPASGPETGPPPPQPDPEAAARRRAARERAARDLEAAEEAAAVARTEQEAADTARETAGARDDAAREHVAELVSALEAARRERAAATDSLRAATEAARGAGRRASAAAGRLEAARAALGSHDG